MQKRDFIQQFMIQAMSALNWDFDKALKYAEKAWFKLSENGYGDTNKQGPRDILKAYDQLAKQPVMKAAFDLFWAAFDKHGNRDRAAMRWLQMGEQEKAEYDRIIVAAKREAAARKSPPEGRTAIHAEGWLTQRRWLDADDTTTDQAQKQQNRREHELRRINQDLAHAKRMAEQTAEDYWHNEVEKLTEQLKQLRGNHD